MNAAPLLDTHIWLWWLLGDSPLKKEKKNQALMSLILRRARFSAI